MVCRVRPETAAASHWRRADWQVRVLLPRLRAGDLYILLDRPILAPQAHPGGCATALHDFRAYGVHHHARRGVRFLRRARCLWLDRRRVLSHSRAKDRPALGAVDAARYGALRLAPAHGAIDRVGNRNSVCRVDLTIRRFSVAGLRHHDSCVLLVASLAYAGGGLTTCSQIMDTR